MKLCKKTLSVVLSMLILVSCINVCFAPIEANASATNPTNAELKAAFDAITDGKALTNGDGSTLNAAEYLYYYAKSKHSTSSGSLGGSYNSHSLTTYNNNTTVNLNDNATSAAGSAHAGLIDSLMPVSGVQDDTKYNTNKKTGDYVVWGWPDFDTSKLSYSVTSAKNFSVKVTANLEKYLLACKSVSDIKSTILLGVTYTYNHKVASGYKTKAEKYDWTNTRRRWRWSTSSWHVLSGAPGRTVNSSNTQAYKDINAFNDHFIKNNLYKTTLKDLCEKSATEIATIITNNNTNYAKLNSYSTNVKNHFFPMSEVDTFMANCVYAQKVINAKPAITALNDAMAAGYDNTNLAEMESIYTAQKPNLDFLADKQDIITYVATNYEGYSNFSLPNATAFMDKLRDDIELYKIREIKAAVDALRAQYPDAEAVAKIDTDANGNYINDNLTLWTTYDIMLGYTNALEGFKTENVAAVFTEGTDYVYDFRSELKFEWDKREAEEQYESFYAWFLPLIYKDLTAYTTEEIINSGIPATTPNIPNATSKKSAYTTMYNKYTALIGADTMKLIFGDGENALGYIIDDYIARLYDVILARLTSEVDTAVGYYDAFGKITLDNFVAVKEAVARVERNIWDFINKNNPSIISSTLRTNYNRLNTLLSQYNTFVAGNGLSGFTQSHLHDSNGVFITREPWVDDLARETGEDYDVTEQRILDTIKKLDAFLVSNDFTELVDIDQDPNRDILLSDFIKETMSEVFYTNDFVNMLMNIVYPALASTLEDVYNGLPKTYDTGIWGVGSVNLSYNSLAEIINKTGIGIYPNQVDDFIANGYGTAKTQLSKASTWKALQNSEGNLTLDWGIDSIKPENYSSTSAYLTAKKNKFLGAMAESFDAILPLVRVLLADRDDMSLTATHAGSASKSIFSLDGDLVLNADGCAGYSDVVVPILEAFGCSGIQNYNTVKNYTTSRQFVDAIFNPIINLIEVKLAKAPAETICSILPNLAYAIPFDKLWDLIDLLNIRIYYTVDDSILGIKVIDKAHVDVKFNTFLKKDSLPLDFDISNFSSTLKYILGSMLPGIDFDKLPILNSGKFIRHAKLNQNASTLRHTGKRLNFEADKADVFVEFLYYLASCLGDEAFVEELLNAFMPTDDGSSALTPEVREIVTNIYSNPDMAIAAVIELLNQQEYALEDYNWYDGTVGGTVEGITPANEVYLSYSNNWTKETADYVDANIDELVDVIMEMAESDLDLGAEITKLINSLFTNKTLTDLAKAVAGISGVLPEKALDIIEKELSIDLTLFNQYADLADGHNWGFEDGDRDGFIEAILSMLSPLKPLYGVIFFEENLTLFKDVNNKDLVTFYGNDGYDAAIVPLLEALGCDLLEGTYNGANAEAGVRAIIKSITDKLDKIAADPINELLNTLPGLLYYAASDALTTGVRNILHPVYVILDTIRPLYNIDLNAMLDLSALEMDINDLGLDFLLGMVEKMSGLKLDAAETVIYDICKVVGTDYTSKSAFVGEGRKGAYNEGVFDRADMITVVISLLLELMEDEENAAVIDSLLQTENFSAALLGFINGVEPETKPINWMYFFGDDHDFTADDFDTGINIVPTLSALDYPNDWTKESAAYIDENLNTVISDILSAIDGEYSDFADLVNGEFNLYSTETVQELADSIKKLFVDFDEKLFEAAKVVLDVDLKALSEYTAPEGIDTSAEFAAALTEMLGCVPGLIDWIFLGEDFRFFTGTKKDEQGNYIYNDIVTIKGAEGYKKGIAPILEALGCENIPTGNEDNIVELVMNSLFTRLDEILSDPDELLNALPNIIYFLNADGLTNSVYNALSAFHALAEGIKGFGEEIDVNTVFGIDLSKLSFVDVVGLLETETGLNLTPVKEIFGLLAIGTIKTYPSLSGEYGYKMTYTENEGRKDMITLLLTVLIQVIDLEENADIIRELLGDEAYTVVLNLLNMKDFEMKKIEYLWTEYADTDKTFSALETSVLYAGHEYGPRYTQEMAQYIADNVQTFIDNIIYLLGIEMDGKKVNSVEDILNSVVNGSLYNSENAQMILDIMLKAKSEIEKLDGSQHIKELIKTSIGVDIDFWSTYKVPAFEDDRAKFTETVCEILSPAYPILKWALCNDSFAFFVDKESKDLVTVLGAEGYAYGIIPLLEALDCENVLTPDEYYALAEADENALVTAILNPLFDRLDVIMAAPADEILEMLPNIIYFINSGGLDTCFKNALHAVYGLLDALKPLIEVDLYELINLRLDEVTFESLFELVIDLIAENTGLEFTSVDGNAFLELTVGKLVTYKSANGETLYKMVYQSETAKAEMVTIALRLLITFLMTEDNRDVAVELLKQYFNMDKDAEKYVRAVLDTIADYTVSTHLGMDSALATVYYLFYGADMAAGGAADGLKDVNKEWLKRLKKLGLSDNREEETVGNLIADILDIVFTDEGTEPGGGNDVLGSNGVAGNGGISFFERIRIFFQEIIDFFKELFSFGK
ncbi:MAG: hypothetical protein IJ962_00285 [Clostridia bacterium]|nr:hypothetical protein [Clostridia bacterium]